MNNTAFLNLCYEFLRTFNGYTPKAMSENDYNELLQLIVTGIFTHKVNPWMSLHCRLNKYPESRYLLIFVEKIICEIDCYYNFTDLKTKGK